MVGGQHHHIFVPIEEERYSPLSVRSAGKSKTLLPRTQISGCGGSRCQAGVSPLTAVTEALGCLNSSSGSELQLQRRVEAVLPSTLAELALVREAQGGGFRHGEVHPGFDHCRILGDGRSGDLEST